MSKLSRWAIVGLIASLLIGLAFIGYMRLTATLPVRIAVSNPQTEAASVLTSIDRWLRKAGRRTQIELVRTENDTVSEQLLTQGKVDFASLRTDRRLNSDLASALKLFDEAALFLIPPNSKIDDWDKLQNMHFALGPSVAHDDVLLQKIVKSKGLEGIKTAPLPTSADGWAALNRQPYSVVLMKPLGQELQTDIKRLSADKPKANWRLLEVDNAELMAETDSRYKALDVPAGALRVAPSLPAEQTTTLAVSRHLITLNSKPSLLLQKILIDFIDAKRALSADVPLLRQLGSPGEASDAAYSIHPGAMSYFAGDELSLFDLVMDWIYIVPMFLGFIGAALSWLYNRLWPSEQRRAHETLVELLVMRQNLKSVTDAEAFNAINARRNALQEAIDDELGSGCLNDKTITALLVAADAVDRKLEALNHRFGDKTA